MTQAVETTGQLAKALHRRHVTMISIGGIIGAGLFVGSSASIAAAGPAIVVSYILAGIVILIVMRMLSEMALAYPDTGAFTEFARLGLGDWAGYLGGWLYWYFWAIVVPVEALAGATILHEWLNAPVWLIGWGLLAVMTGSNLLSTRSYGEFEFWFASIKVAAILCFIVACLAFLGIGGHGPQGWANLTGRGGFAPFGPLSVLSGVASVIFALCGAEIATIAAAEARESAQIISRMTSTVALRILLFYVCSITLIVAITPWTQINSGTSPFAQTLVQIGVPGAALVMKLVVLTAVLSCLNSGLYVASRMLFVLASRGDAPAGLVKLGKDGVPRRAILTSCAIGFIALLASAISASGAFAFLVSASGALMLVIYLLIAAGQIRVRHHLERTEPQRLKLRTWFFPWTSYGVIVAILAILVAMAFGKSSRTDLAASLALVALVAVSYWIGRRRRSPERPHA